MTVKVMIENHPEYVTLWIDDQPILINNKDVEYFVARIGNKNNYACLR